MEEGVTKLHTIYLAQASQLPVMENTIRLFLPDTVLADGSGYSKEMWTATKPPYTGYLTSHERLDGNTLKVQVTFFYLQGETVKTEEYELVQPVAPDADVNNLKKRVIKLCIFRLFEKMVGKKPSPWGILTGIRPTKIVHRLLDHGIKAEEVTGTLVGDYALDAEKALLLTDIALRQRPFLLNKEEATRTVSIYLGIPFCPSRCAYCSFPAYSLTHNAALLLPFLDALEKEIVLTGEAVAKYGLAVQTIYLGGGTPTSLTVHQLERLLGLVNTWLKQENTKEFTVEAGRPDTIDAEKLQVLKKMGASRLSINPQTMHAQTLCAIGRNHTPEQVRKAFLLAREAGFGLINTDIILGLPGETVDHVETTLQEIAGLAPENFTVHTLAMKRASVWKEKQVALPLPDAAEVAAMLELAHAWADRMGMVPYYLYRQKYMVGNFENIGFAKPDAICIYNIQMMEERQTILGLGAAAGSKIVDPGTWLLHAVYNPKDPETYIRHVEELTMKKLGLLEQALKNNPDNLRDEKM